MVIIADGTVRASFVGFSMPLLNKLDIWSIVIFPLSQATANIDSFPPSKKSNNLVSGRVVKR